MAAKKDQQKDQALASSVSAQDRADEIDGAEVVTSAPASDRVVLTDEPKREADKTSYPTGGEAWPEDPPVRAARPDTPIVDSLGTGAGAHVPPDPDVFTPAGRLRDLTGQDDDSDE